MSIRHMIDSTHANLPSALQYIKQLPKGSLVAGYDTGSPDIIWTPEDRAELPSGLVFVTIDQAFTHSPQPSANVIDCESGAFSPGDIDNRMKIATAPRPTLYCSESTLASVAASEKWRGDVLIVQESSIQPTAPPKVPAGFTCIGQQWYFGIPTFDGSVIFDDTWPERITTMPGTAKPPPGQWLNATEWTWQQVIITGRGLNNQLYAFAYDEATGGWNPIPV